MTKRENKSENILIKIYLLLLFFCGIGLWFALTAPPKEKISIDIELEHKVVDTLLLNGVKQSDIVSQYARERETSSKKWSEFYKKIQLRGARKPENFEEPFRNVARTMKLGLSKTENVDGTITYKFYSHGMNYSNITFISPKKQQSKKTQPKTRSKN